MQTPIQYTLDAFENELIELLESTTTFRKKSFSVYTAHDLVSRKDGGIQLPMAGVAYEGLSPTPTDQPANRVSKGSFKATMAGISYSIIIALEYNPTSSYDSKKDAFALLDEVRQTVFGFRGVNKGRPWMLTDERPMETDAEDSDLEGVIFYGQLWSTEVPLTGIHIDN